MNKDDNYKKKRKNKKHSREKKKVELRDINLEDDRILIIDEEIDGKLARKTIEQLLKLDNINHKPITVYLNCPGGSVSDGFAIYDIMQRIKSKIKTVAIGRVASFGTILLLGGNTGCRYIGVNASLMIHEVSSIAMGSVTEMRERLDHSFDLNTRIGKLIANKTKLSYEQVKKYTKKKDKYFNAKQAVKLGFADKIL